MTRTLFAILLSLMVVGCSSRLSDAFDNDLYRNQTRDKLYKATVKAEGYGRTYECTDCIWGVGDTKEEAISDAVSRCRERNNNESLKSNKSDQFSCQLISVNLKPYYAEKFAKQQNLRVEQQKLLKSNLDDNMEMYKSKCVEIGFSLKTKEHANCVLELMKMQSNNQTVSGSNDALINEMRAQEKRQKNQQASDEMIGLSQELLKGKSIGEIYGGAAPKSGGGSGSCILTNSVQSGTNRICYYKCGVSTQTSNVGAAQQCPLTM